MATIELKNDEWKEFIQQDYDCPQLCGNEKCRLHYRSAGRHGRGCRNAGGIAEDQRVLSAVLQDPVTIKMPLIS